MMMAMNMYLSALLYASLLFLLLKGNTYFFMMSISNFTTDMSFIQPSKLMMYFNFTIFTLSALILYFTYFYMKNDLPINRFMTLMAIFVGSMIIMNNSNSCWTTWLGWEGLGVTSYLLIMFYNNWKANNSATSTIMLNRVGDFCLLICLLNFIQTAEWKLNNSKMIPCLLLLAGVATLAKSAQIPLHSWLPIAMAAPTPVSSLVHSSTLVVAGAILCIKLNLFFSIPYMNWLCVTGYLTSFYSSLMALLEKDFKKILAYSTMSQIALVMFMMYSNLSKLMLMHIINHALIKALLFMNIGIFIIFMFGNQDPRLMYLSSSLSPTITICTTCLLTMCGITFTSSCYSKEYTLLYNMKEESILLLINLMIFLSFAYSTRLIYLFFQMDNNNTNSTKTFYPSLNVNTTLMLPMLFNGWIFMYNYSLPLNMTWMNNKNFLLLLPLAMTTFFYLWIFNQMINNIDTMYNYFSNPLLITKNYLGNKMKLINLSFNMNMPCYNNLTLTLWLLSSMIFILTLSFT
uniref:NADH:ubiquinone reductase (H(+)-translocating) n=1 Tax=Trichuris rhinopiptheroxella TaxID=2282176 RepID=A0A346HH51_9BILA|nr:NADH dehydrogenase subunit 5 [Trichuris rhinopiptheroxella]